MRSGCCVGVSDHGGWAIFVTATRDGTLLDRRRVALVDESLPSIPHHHDAQLLPIADGVALVERVRASAESYARRALEELAERVPDVRAIALRACPPLPPTVAERITDYRARNVADWVMYREALAAAARSRDWYVDWYEPKSVFRAAADVLRVTEADAHLSRLRTIIGAPWSKDHRLAMAAAIVTAAL